jgi:methylenetetrahydrofolate dehydrogenase (NADP+)/methenyltetrahydrofolate cyclohydrolase
METQIIDGRKIRNDILKDLEREVMSLPFTPVFCDILVGNNLVSSKYVNIKAKTAESIGIKFRRIEFPESVKTEDLIEEIENLNRVPHMCGIIVQLPLPNSINQSIVLDSILPSLDVDCLGREASNDFYNNIGKLGCPTALACLKIIDSLKLDLANKKIVVLGQGQLVGLPVTHLLRSRGLVVETIDSNTPNTLELLKNADIIISGIGKDKFITGEMIKDGAIIIDAGTSEEGGTIYGDVDFESVNGVASFVTSSPGGVGPVTVAMLLHNVLLVAKQKIQ